MGTVAIDTSVVLAMLDPADAHHLSARDAFVELGSSDPVYRLSAVVFSEALVGAARISATELAHTRDLVLHAFGPVYDVDAGIAERAAILRAEHAWLRLPDALILATAEIEGANVVLTADARWTKVSDKVQVVGRAGPRKGRGR